MKRALAFLALVLPLATCRLDETSPPKDQSPSRGEWGDKSGGQFFCRTEAGKTFALALQKFAVRVTTGPGTVRSHLTLDLAGPVDQRVEAVMRLAVPHGAAVTGAVLWVNGRPVEGAFVHRDRARQIYRAIVERRRDPALVTWDGPGWASVSIFPLEHGEARKFELEWVERPPRGPAS